MDNPLTLWTKDAAGALGALIREWTLEPASLPAGHRMEDDRTCVIPVDAFREAMGGLVEGPREPGRPGAPRPDYQIREGIAEIELILRRPDRASILLPEKVILDEQVARGDTLVLRVPAIYAESGPAGAAPETPAKGSKEPAAYDVAASGNALEAFLDPYLASYCCMQCK